MKPAHTKPGTPKEARHGAKPKQARHAKASQAWSQPKASQAWSQPESPCRWLHRGVFFHKSGITSTIFFFLLALRYNNHGWLDIKNQLPVYLFPSSSSNNRVESDHYAAFKQCMYTYVFPYHQPLGFLLLCHGHGILHKWAEDLSVCGVYDGEKDICNTVQAFTSVEKVP